MNAIRNDIAAAIEKELQAANKSHPQFASLHEAYAVTKEELEEAKVELKRVKAHLKLAWQFVKTDNPEIALQHLARMKFAAENAAVEACQVAAMCQKAIDSEKNRK